MSIRSEKVAAQIKRIVGKPLQELASENNAGMITVTSVKISEDLQVAKIYFSIFGGKIPHSKFIALAETSKGMIRSHIGSNMRLRFVPDLKFFIDDTLDQMEHIQELIKSASPENPDKDYKIDDYDEKFLEK